MSKHPNSICQVYESTKVNWRLTKRKTITDLFDEQCNESNNIHKVERKNRHLYSQVASSLFSRILGNCPVS